MARYLIHRWHQTDAKHFGKIPDGMEASELVEKLQKEQRDFGRRDGITWKVHEGGLVSAMIATREV